MPGCHDPDVGKMASPGESFDRFFFTASLVIDFVVCENRMGRKEGVAVKAIICIPTYNERKNIGDLIALIRRETEGIDLHILVIDSASPDGTADEVRRIQEEDPAVFLICQSAKLGLGKAYLDGMQWVLTKDYDHVITMDADFSHHPRYLRPVLEAADHYELVIGSRYAQGGKLQDWPLRRRLLSRFANGYARVLTGLPFSDLTSGFQCFNTRLLSKLLSCKIHTEGYAFLVELKFLSILQQASYKEVPIVFTDRTHGDSKISKRVILESVLFILRLSALRPKVRKSLKQIRIAGA